ncbi:MAG: class I SAM-dependent methyltransferase [Bacteroidales bacterium]|nr:class I SAM-dependent methyltransferase [Bacteroidales bacterium]
MKNRENWKNSVYVYRKGRLKASRDPKEVGISSRLATDLIAEYYDRNLKKYAKGKLLDLGCGKVPLYGVYREYIDDNTCIDWEGSVTGNEYLDMYADLNSPLDLSDNTYDTILLSDVLEHIKEPKILWGEMARVLKDDGILIINVPFYYWLHAHPHDYYRYTKYALLAFAEESGFEVIELVPIGGAPEIIADITSKTIINLPYIGKKSAIVIQKLTSLFIRTRFGRKVSRSTSNPFPFFYGLIAKKKHQGKST